MQGRFRPVTFIPCNPTLFIRNIKSPNWGYIKSQEKKYIYSPHYLGRLIKTTTSGMTFLPEFGITLIRLFTPLRHSKKK
ncbi:hypothetical protein RIR_jg11646.t1 [Rhizophagus irregularis DAOM 181602=DAOM 197198]|nr:hypothetical protein RIR_jg11646.t1 [Rhizophagus irregularis DAOM 181602=DAOM 197198]